MEVLIAGKQPQLDETGRPVWFHPNGVKIALESFASHGYCVVARSRAAELVIENTNPGGRRNIELPPFKLSWALRSPLGHTRGVNLMQLPELKAAFDFDSTTSQDSEWLIKQYGGTAAAQGKFLRWRRFLNIPGPGTACDGDPNLSVLIGQQLHNAVFNLIYTVLSPEERVSFSLREDTREDLSDAIR